MKKTCVKVISLLLVNITIHLGQSSLSTKGTRRTNYNWTPNCISENDVRTKSHSSHKTHSPSRFLNRCSCGFFAWWWVYYLRVCQVTTKKDEWEGVYGNILISSSFRHNGDKDDKTLLIDTQTIISCEFDFSSLRECDELRSFISSSLFQVHE